MFLCEQCHDADHSCTAMLVPYRSYGLCEYCKRMAVCVDCHNRKCNFNKVPDHA